MNSFLKVIFVFSLSLLFANSVPAEERRYDVIVSALNPNCRQVVVVQQGGNHFGLEISGCSFFLSLGEPITTNVRNFNTPGANPRLYVQDGTEGCAISPRIEKYYGVAPVSTEICRN
jgi:hypothetical protein